MTAQRRVLFLSARLPRLDTDGSWGLFDLLRELARRHHVSLFSLIDHPDEAPKADVLRQSGIDVQLHLREPFAPALDLHRQLPSRLRHDYSSAPLRDAVRARIAAGGFDLLQVEYAEMAFLAAPFVGDLPAVYTCHEPIGLAARRMLTFTDSLLPAWKAWLRSLQAEQAERRWTRGFREVVTLSTVDQDYLQRLLPGLAVRTIPSGIDLSRLPAPTSAAPEPHTILFVGYFRHAPNADAAQWLCREVMPRVRALLPTARLLLVGRDPPPSLAALGKSHGIEATGFVPDLRAMLDRAAVIASPIRLGAGLRGKLIEAWTASKAVVATSTSAEGFAAKDGEHLLLADDADTFAEALVRVLRDDALRQRLGAAGRRLVAEQHTAATVADRYQQVWSDALAAREPVR